jgi:hypothetical protein
MLSTDTVRALARARVSNRMPAPAAIRPSASEAAPMRVTAGSIHTGIEKPSRLAASPDKVAMISGLRSSWPAKPMRPWRAIGQTAATLNSGTQKPISTAINKSPCGPASRSASASPTNELNRNAICALAAWSRASMRRPSHGRCGRE